MKCSAGLLLYRRKAKDFEVFLVHPGGPFWIRKDSGAWTIPKGLIEPGEDPLVAARREFSEETGFTPDGEFTELGTFKQPGGKLIAVWAVEGDCDPAKLTSNDFEMEWPPHSGKRAHFPEVDRGGWFNVDRARDKMLTGQRPMLEKFVELQNASPLPAQKKRAPG